MASFSDQFGGTQIDPADVSYKKIVIAEDYEFTWPPFDTTDHSIAGLIDVQATLPDLNLILPDATFASPGETTSIRNTGLNNVAVRNNAGIPIYTIPTGTMVFFYLTDTSTAAGVWEAIIFGAGVSNLDLSNSAGNGLLVVASRLAVSPIASDVAGNRTISVGDRATAFRWTGGAGAFTLPLSSSLQQFFFEVRNQGTGVLTLTTTGGETIDSSASITLQLGESCFVHSGNGSWFTVGRGRSTQFAFTQLQKTVTGGTVALSLTEAANVVQTYTGALTSNVDIVVPQVVQVYYVSNQTSGAFNFRVKTALAGTTVSIPSGQNAILFSDGTNVINASTTLAGISSLVLGAGSAGSPSLGVGAVNSGLFSPGTNEVGISANSNQVAKFDPTGLTITVNGGQSSVVSATGNASFGLTRPAGSYGVTNYYTGVNQRWRVGVNNTAETGTNNGSDWIFERYADAGTTNGVCLLLSRSSGLATFYNGILATNGSSPGVNISTAGSTSGLNITDANVGAHIKMTGTVAATSKYIRVSATGAMEWVNNAYSAVIATLTDGGTFTAVNVGITSDRTLKSNIRSTLFSSVLRLLRVRGVRYVKGGKEDFGVVAQELDPVYPQLVNKDQEFMSVNYTGLIGELVNSNKLLWAAVAILGALEVWRML